MMKMPLNDALALMRRQGEDKPRPVTGRGFRMTNSGALFAALEITEEQIRRAMARVLNLRPNCILNCDSPSFPPGDDERKQCACVDCLTHLGRVERSRVHDSEQVTVDLSGIEPYAERVPDEEEI